MAKDEDVFHTEAVTHSNANSVYAALTRNLTRAVALYLSRPVRLFRPSKVTGWMMLQASAQREGSHLSLQYLSTLVRQRGVR